MINQQTPDIDAMIEREKHLVAREMQNEAWSEGVLEGIEGHILADAAIATALEEIIRIDGEDEAVRMVETLRERILAGEFTPERIIN